VSLHVYSGPSRGGKGGGSFPGPRDVWGAPPSLKNTEKGVPDGFFLTWNMHKIHFRPAGELTTLPHTLSRMIFVIDLFARKCLNFTRCQKNIFPIFLGRGHVRHVPHWPPTPFLRLWIVIGRAFLKEIFELHKWGGLGDGSPPEAEAHFRFLYQILMTFLSVLRILIKFYNTH